MAAKKFQCGIIDRLNSNKEDCIAVVKEEIANSYHFSLYPDRFQYFNRLCHDDTDQGESHSTFESW